MAKAVLPQKWHQTFHKLNSDGDVDGIRELMETNKIDINAAFYKQSQYSGYSHYLFHALFEGKNIIEKLEYFHAQGVDMNLKGIDGQNALFKMWVRESNLPILEKLLDLGIDANHREDDGATFITVLTQRHGDKLTYAYDGPKKGSVIRQEPEYFRLCYQFIELLLKHGADPSLKNNFDTSALDWIEHRKASNEFEETDEQLEKLFMEYGFAVSAVNL